MPFFSKRTKIVIETFREHIAYMSRELITELSSVNLYVYDISEDIPESLLSNLDTRGISLATEGLVFPRDSPR
jgi:hypothetical protein